jgi:hypothetical protein
MKTLKEYLIENKKVYSFKVKVAGDLPEGFQDDLKKSMEKYSIVSLSKMTTPIQENPMDFPEKTNKEINIFDLVVEYPITAPEIGNFIKEMGITEECFRVRGSGEPSEYDHLATPDGSEAGSLLDDPYYKESTNAKHKDYFGADFNKNFLKELAKAAKERTKELGIDKAKPDVLGEAPKLKTDKAGAKSAIGS